MNDSTVSGNHGGIAAGSVGMGDLDLPHPVVRVNGGFGIASIGHSTIADSRVIGNDWVGI